MIETPLLFVAGILAALLVLWALSSLRFHLHPLLRDMETFWDSRKDLPFADQQTELTLRISMARVRRLASFEVLQRPQQYREIIRNAAKRQALNLATFDKAAARTLVDWTEDSPLEDILYPEAFATAWKAIKARGAKIPDASQPHIDLLGALRIR